MTIEVEVGNIVQVVDDRNLIVIDQGNTVEVAAMGAQGPTGPTGPQGPSGVISVTAPITNSGSSTSAVIGVNVGTTSATVAAGDRGLPAGGTAGQALVKTSATDYATGWTTFLENLPLDTTRPWMAPGVIFSAQSTRGQGDGRLCYNAYAVRDTMTISGLIIEVTTNVTGASARLGLYAATDTWQPTGAPIVDAGTVSLATIGIRTASFTPITLPRGRYVAAMVVSATAGLPFFRSLRGGLTGHTRLSANAFTLFHIVENQQALVTGGFPNPPVQWVDPSFGPFPYDYTIFVVQA